MWFVIGGILFLLVFSSLIMPWINRSRIRELSEDINRIQNWIEQTDAKQRKDFRVEAPSVEEKRKEEKAAAAEKAKPPTKAIHVEEDPWLSSVEEEKAPKSYEISRKRQKPETKKSPEQEDRGFEQQFGGKMFVWLGGIALALAGFFMVKYSIEMGLLSPAVRVVLGIVFGLALLGAGSWVREKTQVANGMRIAQALSGAGIADLYVCLFAATSLYHLVPQLVGFAGMAVITVAAVLLSLRHGPPIAVMGLLGGFMTPAMVGSNDPQAPLLFLYLYVVLAGMMVFIRKQGWWFLSIPATLFAFIWVLIWLFGGNFVPSDTLYLGLFLIATSITVVSMSQEKDKESQFEYVPSTLNCISLGGAIVLMGLVASYGGFTFTDWGLFGLLAVAGIGLAFFDHVRYGLVPWLSMAVNGIMIAAWHGAVPQELALILSAFAALYIVSGYELQSRSQKPLIWAGLTGAASLGYYLLGYFELHDAALTNSLPMFWGFLAFIFAALSTFALQRIIQDVPSDHPQKQHLLAIYAGVATAFLSIGLSVEMKREFLSVAFAGETLALAWINTRVNIKALRSIAGILGCVFGFLLVPQIVLLVQLAAYSLVEARLHLQEGVPIVNWPLFQLGVPAAFFIGSSYLLRKQKDGHLVSAFEIAAIALAGVMGYYLMRHAFHTSQDVLFVKAGFVERGAITTVLFVYGLACLWIGRKFARGAVSAGGIILTAIAVFRIGYFDFIAYNPLWSSGQNVGAWPILNALLLTYGLPIAWVGLANDELARLDLENWSRKGYGLMLVLAFALVSLEVRQFFQGAFLDGRITTDAEFYVYSVVWLIFGIGVLFFGTVRRDRMMRVASLIIMLLTIGKVFLWDAAQLAGLWRVFSFFGLGLSLLGLSWFYSRYVFVTKRRT